MCQTCQTERDGDAERERERKEVERNGGRSEGMKGNSVEEEKSSSFLCTFAVCRFSAEKCS